MASYYDPTPWIAPGDRTIEEVESLVGAPKRARQKTVSAGGEFRPPAGIELEVIVDNTKERLRLTFRSVYLTDEIYITLSSQPEGMLRMGHFNTLRPHTNPDHRVLAHRHHAHFPTLRYQNQGPKDRKYAFPVICTEGNGNAPVEGFLALRVFCDGYVNTNLRAVSFKLQGL